MVRKWLLLLLVQELKLILQSLCSTLSLWLPIRVIVIRPSRQQIATPRVGTTGPSHRCTLLASPPQPLPALSHNEHTEENKHSESYLQQSSPAYHPSSTPRGLLGYFLLAASSSALMISSGLHAHPSAHTYTHQGLSYLCISNMLLPLFFCVKGVPKPKKSIHVPTHTKNGSKRIR